METKKIYIGASCAAGWARRDKLSDAIRAMLRYSRGYYSERMTLGKFLDALDDQRISLSLLEETDGGKFKEIGTLGDNYNTAKLLKVAEG